ncbi:MAG: hypothetical protein KC766_24935 [Myxococcales bacterium]|nr:hypothetical protein [Myxococcales bacterium]
MPSVESTAPSGSLKHRLLTLSELELRARWLQAELPGWGPQLASRILNELAGECEAAHSRAREAMVAVALCLVRMADEPWLRELSRETSSARLLSLERLLRRGEIAPEEQAELDQLRVPDYGAGRELSLGERRALARRPERRHFDRLLGDPHPMVVQILLRNPRLTLDDVVRMTSRRPANRRVLREIVTSSRWVARSRVRLSVLLNPGAPDPLVMPFLPLCGRQELQELIDSSRLPLVRRATAHELLERRPPMAEPDALDVH